MATTSTATGSLADAVRRVTPIDPKQYDGLLGALRRHPIVKEAFLSGSVSRGTAVPDHSDVDCMLVLDPAVLRSGGGVGIKATLEGFVDTVLRESGVRATKRQPRYRTQEHSIGVRLEALSGGRAGDVDLVGVIRRDDGQLKLPEGPTEKLRKTAPEEYTAAWEAAVTRFSELPTLVRLLKLWNYTNDKPLNGFHIERVMRRLAAGDVFRGMELAAALPHAFALLKDNFQKEEKDIAGPGEERKWDKNALVQYLNEDAVRKTKAGRLLAAASEQAATRSWELLFPRAEAGSTRK